MKRTIFTSILLSVFVISIPVKMQALEAQKTGEQTGNSNADIASYKQTMYDYYSDRITEAKLNAQEQIRLLEIVERYCSTYDRGFFDWAQVVQTVLRINGLDKQAFGYTVFAFNTAPKYLAEALSEISTRKSRIINDLEWQVTRLERLRLYETTQGLEELIKERQEAHMAKPVQTFGVVNGIIYSSDKPVAIIDGAAVQQNESIHNVKVVRINKDSVEFERNGAAWTQKTGEKQEAKWK
jgi:hypothetical protein